MPGFSCFLLKYAGRMRDEAYLDLIGCCGRARTVTNAAGFHARTSLQFTGIDQCVGLKYYRFISMKVAP